MIDQRSLRQRVEDLYKPLQYADYFDMTLDENQEPDWGVKEACSAIRRVKVGLIELLQDLELPPPTRPAPEPYWLCRCPTCKWRGHSGEADGGDPMADTGDFNDVVCPVCGDLVEDDYIRRVVDE